MFENVRNQNAHVQSQIVLQGQIVCRVVNASNNRKQSEFDHPKNSQRESEIHNGANLTKSS